MALALRTLGWLAIALLFPASKGDLEERALSFARDVRPILAEHCFECHGPDVQEAELRFDRREGLFADLGLGLAVVAPGQSDQSELMSRVMAAEGDRMPPAKHGDRLGAEAIDTLRQWIDAGAEWEAHWAFEAFRELHPRLDREDSWVRNDLDRFILHRLEREGVHPSPQADRRTLARRLSFDLTGLPPTPEELQAFLNDEQPGAIESYVDHLLSSPHFGEHWGRHWLDLARYADSHGYTIDGGRSMWPYRDWVVNAVQQDQPFDQFTIEQLAGDLLPQATRAQRIATGFHRNTPINQEGGAKDEENRVNAVVDRVNTTAAVWMGVTMECAQCHDHKFDPISQLEYFQMFALFDQTEDGGVHAGPSLRVPESDEERALLDRYEAREHELNAALRRAQEQACSGWTPWRPEVFTAENGSELVLAADDSVSAIGQRPESSIYDLRGAGGSRSPRALRIEALPDLDLPQHGPGRGEGGSFELTEVRVAMRAAGGGEWQTLSLAEAEQARVVTDGDSTTGWGGALEPGVPQVLVLPIETELSGPFDRMRIELAQEAGQARVLGRFRLLLSFEAASDLPDRVTDTWLDAWQARVEHARDEPSLPTTLVMRRRERPRVTRLHRRGSFLDPGPVVLPGVPAVLDHFEHEPVVDRLSFARWLVHPENALAQRVTVNRIWQHLFGRGLVASERDFGSRGAQPSHPDLLEHLARTFVEDGFSRQRLIRRIVTSATYLQSSQARPDMAESDPSNELLARQNRLRLPAESIRDATLRASGLLAAERGGPPVQPPQPAGVDAFTQNRKGWETSAGRDRYRRTLYTRLWRSNVHPFLTTFDFPSAAVTCTRRTRSQTPLQALTLANDPMMLELVLALGRRVCREAEDEDGRLQRLFALALSRPPAAAEVRISRAFLEEERTAGRDEERAFGALARVLVNLEEFCTRE